MCLCVRVSVCWCLKNDNKKQVQKKNSKQLTSFFFLRTEYNEIQSKQQAEAEAAAAVVIVFWQSFKAGQTHK